MLRLGQLRTLFRSGWAQNALALYGVQLVTMVTPLLTIPYLTRVLGPDSFGYLTLTQTTAGYLTIGIEYGFHLSAVRDVSQNRGDKHELARIVSDVIGAKLLLAIFASTVMIVIASTAPFLRFPTSLLFLAVFSAVAQAFSVYWFFQGIEQMKVVAALDAAARIVSTMAVFGFVRNEGDVWKILVLQGLASCASLAVSMYLLYHVVPFRFPTLRGSLYALRSGWTMFIYRSAVSCYTLVNTLVLGLLSSPTSVAYYAGAEKITLAFWSISTPLSNALYPRISHLVHTSLSEGTRWIKSTLKGMVLLAVGGSLALSLLAGLLVRLLLGSDYVASVEVLRILAWFLPFNAIRSVLGLQWMAPLGLERIYAYFLLAGIALEIVAAYTLVPLYGAVGMAVSVVLTELAVALTVHLYLKVKNIHPWFKSLDQR